MRSAIDPTEAHDLLAWLRNHGFGAWHLVNAAKPSVIVLFRQWGGWVDVVHIRGCDRVEAARMPRGDAADIFRPEKIIWHYYGGIVNTLAALKDVIARGVEPTQVLYEPPRAGHPSPLFVTDDEMTAKKAFYPPSDVPMEVPPCGNGS
jgi:hypothetical protein